MDNTGEDYDHPGDDPVCSWCGGEPLLQECDGQYHPCTACGGTGLAEYQVIW